MAKLDDLAKAAGDLDYPGRRKPRNRGITPPPEEVVLWDEKPVGYGIDGKVREFFTISHLSKALGYSQQSIRLWETQGLLPKSGWRSPRTRAPVAAGRSTKGKRLWTREQIEAILRIAEEHGVLLNKQPPTVTFARAVEAEFLRLPAPRLLHQ